MGNKAGLGFATHGSTSLRHREPNSNRPAVQRIGQSANLGFVGRVAVEVCGRPSTRQRTRMPNRSSTARNCRPGDRTRCPGNGRRSPYNPKHPAQGPCGQSIKNRRRLRVILAANWRIRTPRSTTTGIVCQRHSDCGDTHRGGRLGLIAYQSVVGIRLVQVVQQGRELQTRQIPPQ